MNKTTAFLATAGALALLAVVIGLPRVHGDPPAPRPPEPKPVTIEDPRPIPPPVNHDGSLKMETRLSHPYLTAGQSDVFLTVDLTGQDVPGADRAPVNLALVIDRSGSMAGPKLEHAKEAAQHLVRQLRDSDRLTIIHYGSEVRELRALAATDANKAVMRRFIAGIQDEGGTNIGAALKTAERELQSGLGDYKSNRIILITDGQPTEGITNGHSLVRIVQEIRESGMTVSAIGVGDDFNEDLLQQFAEYGAGSYGFLEDTQRLATLFQKDLQQASTAVARQVEVAVKLPAGVELEDVLGHRFNREGDLIRIPMTDFAAGQVERVVARLRVNVPQRDGSVDVAGIHLAYQDVLHDKAADADSKLASMITEKREEVVARRDKEATVIAARAEAAMNMGHAADALAKGDRREAERYVDANKKIFFEAGEIAGSAAVAQDEAQYAPPAAAFAAAPAEQVQTKVKAAKAQALKGLGRIGSTY